MKSILYGGFVRARKALKHQKRRSPAPRAAACLVHYLLTIVKGYQSPFCHTKRSPARAEGDLQVAARLDGGQQQHGARAHTVLHIYSSVIEYITIYILSIYTYSSVIEYGPIEF